MKYRIDKEALLEEFGAWDGFLNKPVHLIACGGTALTLLGAKPSTKDIDLIAPVISEYEYLLRTLTELGYKRITGWGLARDKGFAFDIFRGNRVHTTELIESPLNKNNHIPFKQYSHLYIGILNYYDILITKLFRSTSQDIDDCLLLMKAKGGYIKLKRFIERFKKTASFDVSEIHVNKNLEYFLKILAVKGKMKYAKG
jgi:hypothetical protein